MTHRLFGAVAVVALASFAAATPSIAKSDSRNTNCPANGATVQTSTHTSHGSDQRPAKTGRHERSARGYAAAQSHQAQTQAFVRYGAARPIFC